MAEAPGCNSLLVGEKRITGIGVTYHEMGRIPDRSSGSFGIGPAHLPLQNRAGPYAITLAAIDAQIGSDLLGVEGHLLFNPVGLQVLHPEFLRPGSEPQGSEIALSDEDIACAGGDDAGFLRDLAEKNLLGDDPRVCPRRSLGRSVDHSSRHQEPLTPNSSARSCSVTTPFWVYLMASFTPAEVLSAARTSGAQTMVLGL